MIRNVEAANINNALAGGIRELIRCGVKESSRNGPVLVHPEPVCTTYANPTQRVLFSPVRDANPFFHLMEAVWMLGGRNDIAWPSFFASNMKNYSDDGVTQNGAYGYRWRRHFKYDQLEYIVHELRKSPDSRRAVLAMWDGSHDLQYAFKGGKDAPCNTHAYFSLRRGVLDLLVCCRSNDIIWGAYGANAVHFSFLHEYIASWLGVPMGRYRHLSYNFHAYLDNYSEAKLEAMAKDAPDNNFYFGPGYVTPMPLRNETPIELWHEQLGHFLQHPEYEGNKDFDPFFAQIAAPMYASWKTRKEGTGTGFEELKSMPENNDWRRGCADWITRRILAKEKTDA